MKISEIVVERGHTADGQDKRYVGFQINRTVYEAFKEAHPEINLTKTFENFLKELTEALPKA